MGTRVHVAASACFVVSGLFMCGLGGALAFADTPPPPRDPGATHSNEVLGNSVHDSRRLGLSDDPRDGSGEGSRTDPGGDDGKTGENDPAGNDSGEEKPDDEEPEEKPDDETDETDETEVTITEHPSTQPSPEEPDPPTESPTTDLPLIAESQMRCPEKGSNRQHCEATTTPPTTTTSPPGFPGPGGGGGGGGGGGYEPPSGRLEPPSGRLEPPPMQLPPEAPTVVSVAPGLAVAAGELPLEPITLPVIVAPALAPGLGGGGGGPLPANPALPGPPRAVAAEPPAGRDPLPATVGSNAVVPASSYRIGYTEYLRSAGIPQVAALAVPGVAGMLVLTAAGGLVGYRQAKAGLAVRTGGTARFVN